MVHFFTNKCNIIDSSYTQYNYLFTPGFYRLEAWSSSGGNATVSANRAHLKQLKYGEKGGYSKGVIQIFNPSKAFIYVGDKCFYVSQVGVR